MHECAQTCTVLKHIVGRRTQVVLGFAFIFSISLKACMSCQLETTEVRKQCSKSPRKKGKKCLVIRLKQGGFSLCTFCLFKKKQEEQTVI